MSDLSLRAGLQSFTGPPGKVVPLNSASELASRFVVDAPVSLRHLLSASDLVKASQTFHAPLDADTVGGWVEVQIWSDGMTGFRGHVHESGAISHYFNLWTSLDVWVDVGPTPLLCNFEGWVHGTVGLGSRDSDWSITEYTQYSYTLALQWDVVRSSPKFHALFDVRTDVFQGIETLAAVALASGVAMGAEQLASRVAIALT